MAMAEESLLDHLIVAGPCLTILDLKLMESFKESPSLAMDTPNTEAELFQFIEKLVELDREVDISCGVYVPSSPILTEKFEKLFSLEEKMKKMLVQIELLVEAGHADGPEAPVRKVLMSVSGQFEDYVFCTAQWRRVPTEHSFLPQDEESPFNRLLADACSTIFVRFSLGDHARFISFCQWGKNDVVHNPDRHFSLLFSDGPQYFIRQLQNSSRKLSIERPNGGWCLVEDTTLTQHSPIYKLTMMKFEICASFSVANDVADLRPFYVSAKWHTRFGRVCDFIGKFKVMHKRLLPSYSSNQVYVICEIYCRRLPIVGREVQHSRPPEEESPFKRLSVDTWFMVLLRLGLGDHVRLKSVCKWSRSVVENSYIKPFSLVCSDNPKNLIRQLLSYFWKSWVSARFIGSLDGGLWLVVETDYGRVMSILNPASQTLIPLPPHQDDPGKYYTYKTKKVVLSSSPLSCNSVVVLLSNHHRCTRLHFCKPGDTEWTMFYESRFCVIDIVFYKDQLYALDLIGQMKIFDSGFNSNPTILRFPWYPDAYLVNAFDKLLVICREIRCGDPVLAPKRLIVFKIDPTNLTSVELETLGDNNVLFFSYICSPLSSSKDHPQFTPNHVYEISSPGGDEFFDYSLELKTVVWGNTWNRSCPLFFSLFRSCNFEQI